MSISQILALTIFLVMFVFIVLEIFERHVTTLVSALLMLGLVFGWSMHSTQAMIDTVNLSSMAELSFWYGHSDESAFGINWATIVFIAGMTVMVEGMGHSGFFRWLCLKIAKLVNYRTIPLLICFTIMAGALSMFIDSITVIMFLVAVTIELSRILKFDPVPMIVAEVFCANLGGTATMCGDPPNVIIGTALGYTFFDFISNTGVIVAVCFLFVVPYFVFVLGKGLKESEKNRPQDIVYPNPADAITNKSAFIASGIVFAITVVLLVTHAQIGLTVAAIGAISATLTIIAVLITFGPKDIITVLKRVDYKTLLFFIGLFVVVCGLEATGILEVIANFISDISGGNLMIMIAIILWVSAIASAFIDNIPFAATMVPVIQTMAASTGVPLDTLAWTLALGTNIGGNATPIGASANVVGTSLAAKDGHPITWGRYCKYNAPATIFVATIAMIALFVRYC